MTGPKQSDEARVVPDADPNPLKTDLWLVRHGDNEYWVDGPDIDMIDEKGVVLTAVAEYADADYDTVWTNARVTEPVEL